MLVNLAISSLLIISIVRDEQEYTNSKQKKKTEKNTEIYRRTNKQTQKAMRKRRLLGDL